MKTWLFLLCCAFSLILNATTGKVVSPPQENILILTSFHLSHPWTDQLVDTIRSDCRKLSRQPRITIVSFDMMRIYESQDMEKKLLRYLKMTQDKKFDLIVALDSPINDLLFRHAKQIPHQVPVVFGGYENPPADLREKHSNVTGVIQINDAAGTLRSGLALYPKTRTVMILSDDSQESRRFLNSSMDRLKSFKGINFICLSNSDETISTILAKISALPEESLVMLAPWRGLRGNEYQSLAALGVDLNSVSKRPYLVNCTGMLNCGALGGIVTDPITHGHEVSRLIKKVLKKGSAIDIPFVQGAITPIFDWNEICEHNLETSRLPKRTFFLNHPQIELEKHRTLILAGLGILLSVIAGAIGYIRIARRNFQRGRDVLRFLPGRIAVINRKEKVLFLNASDLTNIEVKNIRYMKDIPRSDYEKVSAAVKEVFHTGENSMLEYESMGAKRVMFLKMVPKEVFGEEAVVWFSHDNAELQEVRTEAQEYAEKLKRSTRMWNLVINALPIHIFAKAPANDFRFVFSNKGMQDFTRLRDEEIRGKTDFDIYPKETAAIMRKDDEKNIQNIGKNIESIVPIPDAEGKIHLMRTITRPFIESDGSCLLIGAAFDVTEQEQAKQEAEESAEWFRLTLNSIGDGVITTDRSGKVTMMNPVAERMLGIPKEEALGLPHDQIFRIYNYDTDQPSPSPVMRTLRTGMIVELANHTDLIARNGTRYHIADSAAPIFGPDGRIFGAILVFRDVTEEYAQRDRLHYAYAQLEAGTKISKAATFIFNPATHEITGSSLLPKLLPVTDGRISAINGWVYEEDLPAMLAKWKKLVQGEISSATFDYRTKDQDGFHYYRLNSSADRSNPRQEMYTGVVQDVTDIRRVFDQLQEQQNLWEKVINSIPLCFFAKDADDDFRYVLCNQAFASFVGRTPETVIGKTDAELFTRPEDAEKFRDRDKKIMNKPDGESFEESVVDARGNLHSLQTVKKPFSGLDGRNLLLGASSDITDLRQLLSCEKLSSEVLAAMATNDESDAMLEDMAGILMKHMECDRILLACCNQEGLLRLRNEWLSPGTVSIREVGLEKHYELWDRNIQAFHDNHILKTSDVTQAEFCPGLIRDDKYRTISLIVVPVFVHERLWGALFVSYSRIRREFNDIDERIMRSCANVISMALIAERQRHTIRQTNLERQLVLDNIHIPIWLHDNRGQLIRANTAVGDLFGIPAPELNSEKNRKLLESAFPPGTVQPIEESLKTGRAVHRKMTLLGRDYIFSAEPVFDSFGHLTYIVKSAIDMTEFNELLSSQAALNTCLKTLIGEPDLQKALEKTLQTLCAHLGASRAYIFRFNNETHTMSSMVEHVANKGDAIFSDIKDQPYSASPNWFDRFGKEQTIAFENVSRAKIEEYGKFWSEKIDLEDMRSIYATRLIVHKNIWGYLGLIYEHHSRSLEEDAHKFLQSSAHFIEIMLQRQQSQDQLVQAMEKAQAADKAKSFFIASVSHEIRTPLNAVIGFSDLLRNGGIPEAEAKEYLDSISYSGNALLQLINDVLDLSKLEADQMKIEPVPANFRELSEEVMKVFQYHAKEHEIKLLVDIPEMPEMELDKLRIRQVLFNLIGNAVKFTTEGSVTLKAEYQPNKDGTCEFSFMVIDTGSGIAQEDQSKLMKPFVQLSRVRGTSAGNNGTGLGLTISKRLIEKMGGTLWVKSEPGKGSVFGVSLHQIHISKDGNTMETGKKAPTHSASTPSLSILIVDDVEMNLKVMKALCRKAGVKNIETAMSGAEALALLKIHTFDLVLTDLWMPEMNGVVLAEKIRSDKRFQNIPILAITADVEAKDNFSLKNFNGILLKPVTLEKVYKMIKFAKHI